MSNIIFESDFPSGTAIPSATSGNGLGNDTWEFQKKIQFDSNVTIMTGQTLTLTGVTVVGLSSGVDTITATNANAFAVGQNGATNPAFNVDTSTASSATGFNVKSAAAASGAALSVISSGTNEAGTLDSKGNGTFGINTVSTTAGLVTVGNSTAKGGLTVQGPTTGVSASANALSVGLTGATNPAFNVDASTASQVAGLNVKGAATGGTVAVSVTDSGANASATFDGKGNGTVGINTTSATAGKVTIGNTSALNGLAVNGSTNVLASVGAISGGAATATILFGSVSGLGVYFGSGAPTISAAQGSLYVRTDGNSTSTRMYINTNGSTTWTAVTTAA